MFKKYNIQVPVGGLLTTIQINLHYPLLAKAQVLTGGRGKARGIKEVRDDQELNIITQT